MLKNIRSAYKCYGKSDEKLHALKLPKIVHNRLIYSHLPQHLYFKVMDYDVQKQMYTFIFFEDLYSV